jgi:hypothetical protein
MSRLHVCANGVECRRTRIHIHGPRPTHSVVRGDKAAILQDVKALEIRWYRHERVTVVVHCQSVDWSCRGRVGGGGATSWPNRIDDALPALRGADLNCRCNLRQQSRKAGSGCLTRT